MFLVLGLIKMQEMALAVGMSDQIPTLKEKERFYKTAIVEKFYDPKTERFCGGVQGADAFALEIGLGGRELARCVAEHYDELGYYDTGIFGTYLLTKNLFDYGYADVAFKLLTKEEKPSFGYLKNCGATTLYENLLMTGSDCHPMFGAVVELFFTRIMGLAVSSSEKYVVKPCIPKGLTFAKASIKIEKKEIFAEFERVNECVEYEIKIPNGFNAEMHLNGQKVPLKCGNNKILIK